MRIEVISPDNQIYLNRWGTQTPNGSLSVTRETEGQKKSSPRSIIFSCTPQGSCETALNK